MIAELTAPMMKNLTAASVAWASFLRNARRATGGEGEKEEDEVEEQGERVALHPQVRGEVPLTARGSAHGEGRPQVQPEGRRQAQAHHLEGEPARDGRRSGEHTAAL